MGHRHCAGSNQTPSTYILDTHGKCHHCDKVVRLWGCGKMKKHSTLTEAAIKEEPR